MAVFMITGASGGAGEAVARRLLERGDSLLLVARNEERLAELVGGFGSDAPVAAFTAQVADPSQAAAAVARARERFGRIDGLIGLTGAFRAGQPVFLAETSAYTELFEANLLASAMAAQAVLRQLEGPGWFVFLTSLLAREPMPTMGPYAASKAALEAWAKAFSREVMGQGHHVNVIDTTIIDTPHTRAELRGGDPSTWVAPESIADVIAFLTSTGAGSMYGGLVPVHGKFAPGRPGGPPGAPGGGPPPGAPGRAAGEPGAPGPPEPALSPGGDAPARQRYALLYPFKPGRAAEAEPLFREGADPPPQAPGSTRLLSTTVFRFGDTVVRSFEIEGDLDEAIEHMVMGTALSDLGRRLRPLLDESVDLTTPEGLRAFFHGQLMEVVIDRVVPDR